MRSRRAHQGNKQPFSLTREETSLTAAAAQAFGGTRVSRPDATATSHRTLQNLARRSAKPSGNGRDVTGMQATPSSLRRIAAHGIARTFRRSRPSLYVERTLGGCHGGRPRQALLRPHAGGCPTMAKRSRPPTPVPLPPAPVSANLPVTARLAPDVRRPVGAPVMASRRRHSPPPLPPPLRHNSSRMPNVAGEPPLSGTRSHPNHHTIVVVDPNRPPHPNHPHPHAYQAGPRTGPTPNSPTPPDAHDHLHPPQPDPSWPPAPPTPQRQPSCRSTGIGSAPRTAGHTTPAHVPAIALGKDAGPVNPRPPVQTASGRPRRNH